ncbi:hypothetical protein, partial [Staphylococcus borealis]|uniref:hypothetical protein n=1 Tax=Staphylococcus borealis TaxID=2742203 RepID=UPI0039ED4247
MKQKTLEVLEFNKIKTTLLNEVISDLGAAKIHQLSPSTDFDTVVAQMEELDEIAQIYNQYRLPSLSGLSKYQL